MNESFIKNFEEHLLLGWRQIMGACLFLLIGAVVPVGVCAETSGSVSPYAAQQQTMQITGIVYDETGETLPGASVVEKGTVNGTATNVDGAFSLNVAPNATLVVSYIGYLPVEVKIVPDKTDYAITLENDSQLLDEVVVVGYGVQKKKLVTGATVQVSGDAIAKQSTTSAFTAMQSQMPGVNIIQNNGQPGEEFKVNIRGIGTVGNYQPLYIIDGVAGGDLNALNPADIESIDVLKDAASAAIYGSRAANGVILVTTKSGKSGKISVTYDAYYGVQNPYKLASLLNAQQYTQIQDELQFNQGLSGYNWQSILGPYYEGYKNGTWTGTNWLEATRNKNAPVQNHAISLAGGNNVSTFAIGLSYTDQEGILGSPNTPHYGRTTARINSDHILWKSKDGFDIIKFGEVLNYGYTERNSISSGNQYGNDISQMLRAMPIMPVKDAEGNYFDYDDNKAMGLEGFDGMMANPIGVMASGKSLSKNYRLNAAANLQIQPIKNLIFKTQFGYRMTASSYRSFGAPYHMSTTSERKVSTAEQNMSSGWNYTLDNTLNYKFDYASANHFDVLVGQSLEKWGMGEYVRATNGDLLFDDFKHAYIDNTQGIVSGQTSVAGNPWGQGALASFFGRVNYDYNETYMLSLIARADGSSNFARGQRWGYFPSVSGGWVVSNESFMESARDIVSFLKIRASWGRNGNSNIDNFHYLSLISFDATAAYSFGNNVDAQQTGGYAQRLPNENVTWETSEQLDFGIDARFFKSRLGVVLDYYKKTTKDWLVRAPILSYYGMGSDGAPYINGGDIENKGYEIGLNWNGRVATGLTYGAGINLAYNHNEVIRIANAEGILHGKANAFTQGTSEMYRAEVGYPIGYFYGYKTAGIFQNQADIDAWKAAGNGILQPNVQPGDVKFVDRDHDGVVNDNDKTMIGNPHPDFTLGFNFNIGYKGADLSVSTYGAFGQQIAKNYRKYADSPKENYTAEVYERWHGEGTSNKWPRLTPGSGPNYINVSDIFIEDADYLKIQDITLGYDLKYLFPKLPLGQLRAYVKIQNPYIFTKYSGMDPEVGYSPDDNSGTDSWAQGLDLGNYPYPRTVLFGINVKF